MKNLKTVKLTVAICFFMHIQSAYAQVTGIAINDNNASADASAMLDVNVVTATSKKGLLIPRVTTTQRDAITSPATSLLVYNTTNARFEYYTGSSWQPIIASGAWSLTGNSSTNPPTNFIGTTDYNALIFKVNNTQAGYLGPSGTPAVALGYSATASNNSIAIGASATTNTANEAIALGYDATASAYQSVALGSSAQATSNNHTIAIGYDAQASAYESIAIGASSRTTSSNNQNIAIGVSASASGYQATAIGNGASATAQNSMALGNGASVGTANYISIGNTSIQAIKGQVTFSTYSDGRFKTGIHPDVPGLSFITRLRPVTYTWDIHRLNNYTSNGIRNVAYNENEENAINEKEKIRYTGFIAQEVEKAANETGYDFSGVIKPKSSKDLYSLSYAEFVVPLVKAAQELNEKNELLSKKLQGQQEVIDQLLKRLDKLEKKK